MNFDTFKPLPSENHPLQLNTGAGFRFTQYYGGKMALKNVHYKPAEIYRGKKWYVFYSYRDPETYKFKRFRVYEDINRLKGDERESYAELLKNAVNFGLSKGYNPFEVEELTVVKKWTLVQGLNYFKQNLRSRGLRERSIQQYESTLIFLYEYLAPILQDDINKITKHQIQVGFRKAQTARKWTNSTYNNYITFTRTIFNFLKDEGILQENPAKIKFLPESFKRNKAFSKDIFDKIMKEADAELQEFLMFLYHTTARPHEAIQLQDTDFLLDRKLLHIKDTISKTRKERFVPLSEYMLARYPKKKGRVFEVTERYFTSKFKKVKDELELPPEYTMYSIKHTRCLHLAEDGVSIYFIMQLLGHSSPMTTMSYLRDLGANINREAVEKGIRF